MISHQKKFIFFHIPKTAGNSIQNILADYSDDEIIANARHQDGIERFEVKNSESEKLHKHSTLRDYKKVFGGSILKYFIFSTIRNPWDRIVSFYFSPHRGVTEFNFSDFEKFAEQIPPIETYLAKSRTNFYFFNRKHISHLMKFEEIDNDFDRVCKELGIGSAPLPVRNKSNRIAYRDCYSTALAEHIRQKHRAEIEIGKYEF